MAGVHIESLVFSATLDEALDGTGFKAPISYNQFTVIDDLLIHIVQRGGRGHWRVQQILPEEEAGGLVREIVSPEDEFGIGRDKAAGAVVGGAR